MGYKCVGRKTHGPGASARTSLGTAAAAPNSDKRSDGRGYGIETTTLVSAVPPALF